MNTLLLFSGGLDSTTLLYDMQQQGHVVECLTVDYRQIHGKEIRVATEICKDLGVKQRFVQMPRVYSHCALVGGAAISPVVPNRNMILIGIAAAMAFEREMDAVAWGANADDAELFPDCRRAFYNRMTEALHCCHDRPMILHAPFLANGMSKSDVVTLAKTIQVPIEKTWSCYEGKEEPCNKCHACVTRNNAL